MPHGFCCRQEHVGRGFSSGTFRQARYSPEGTTQHSPGSGWAALDANAAAAQTSHVIEHVVESRLKIQARHIRTALPARRARAAAERG